MRVRFLTHHDLVSQYGIPWSLRHVKRLAASRKFPEPRTLGHRTVVFIEDEIEDFVRGTWRPAPAPDEGEALDLIGDAA